MKQFFKISVLFFIALFSGILLLPDFYLLAALENFTTYTEADPNNVLSVAADTITVTNLQRQSGARVYKDFGAGYFGNNFEHLVSFQVDSITTANDVYFIPWAVANTASADAYSDPAMFLLVAMGGSGGMYVYLAVDDGAVDTSTYWGAGVGGFGTRYYATITRDGTALTAKIYNDANRTNLLTTLSITVGNSAYQYVYGTMSRGGSSAGTTSGYVYNLDLQAAADITPPVRSNGSPSGALSAGTTQTTISLTTNESATCRYSTTAGASYDSMTNTLSITGGTSHSTQVSSLSDGNSYSYYIKCSDASGNKNTDDFTISFSVATPVPGDTTSPIRSNGAPTGILTAGTIQTNLSLNTDESATCRYSTTADTAYSSMTNTFITTGGASHSTLVTGLTNGNTYNFYVRCQDAANNPNTSDYAISFSVATVAAGDATTIGTLSLVATYKSISIYAPFTNDNNANNSVSFRWRESGGAWKQGMAMTVDRRSIVTGGYLGVPAGSQGTYSNPFINQWRASVLMLQPNTQYQVEVTFSDADGITGTNPLTTTITTKNDVIPLGTGNTYYVSPTGGSGTACVNGYTFQTIQRAANCVQAGDTVYVRAGTYPEQVVITVSGTATNYITFLPFGTDEVIIDGQGTLTNNIKIGVTAGGARQGGNYVRVSGFKVRNAYEAGIYVDSNNIVIEKMTVEDFNVRDLQGRDDLVSAMSFRTQVGGSNITVRDNTITRNIGVVGFNSPNGISIYNDNSNAGGWAIYNNRIYGNGGRIKDCIGGGKNFEIPGFVYRDSDIYDNYLEQCYDDGIEIEGADMNVRVWGNTIKSPRTIGIGFAPVIIGPLYVFRNTLVDAGTAGEAAYKLGESGTGQAYVYHDSVYTSPNSANGPTGSGSNYRPDNLVFKNNIFYTSRYVYEWPMRYGGTYDFNYNLMYSTRAPGSDIFKWCSSTGSNGCGTYNVYSTFAAFQTGTGQELNGIYAIPQFVDAVNGNLRLQPTSPAIDKGVSLVGFNDANSAWPYRGTAPDVGAYEYDSGAPVDTTPPVRSSGAPIGTLTAGTIQTNITLNTDEPATCRYSTAAGTAYSSMTNTFSTTGGTSHSTQVTGLTNGTTYNYYVRCQDTAGNPNTTDYTISFSVASAPVAGATTVGILELITTYESIGIYANFSGDDGDNSASFRWRQSGGVWKQGMTMTVDRRATVTASGSTFANPYQNQWRASIIGVQPNTSYDVEVTFTDSDGVSGTNPITQTITTRNDNVPLGSGNSYYVSPSGSDTNSGTEAQPFLTIQRAANVVTAGGTVYIKAGTYPEQVNIPTSGTANNWITFMNYGSEVATINGGSIRTRNMTISSRQYIRIKGLRFIDAYGGANDGAVRIDTNSSNIVIEDNYFTGFGSSAIFARDSGNIVIQRNEILRTARKRSGFEGHLISFWYSLGGHTVRDNTIRDISNSFPRTDYWDCIGGGPNFGLNGFVNKDSDIYNNYVEGCPDDGIELEGAMSNVRVWGNTIKNTYIGIAYAPIIVGPLYVYKNIIETIAPADRSSAFKLGQSSTGLGYIYHNTIYFTGPYDGFKQTNSGLQNIVSRNNIIHAGRYVIEFGGSGSNSGHDFNYDSLFTTDPGRFIKWDNTGISFSSFQSRGQELQGMNISATNEFVDAANSNFNLKSTSQFIDKGVALTGFNDANSLLPYRGTAPDLGVYEYDSGAPVDITPPVRSSGAPIGTLTAGTTQTNLSLNTGESATCRYSTTVGTIYSSMTSIFTTTGGASHSTQVTGLTNGNTYNFYVRCQDAASNPNTTDYTISFSISTLSGFAISGTSGLYLFRDGNNTFQTQGSNFDTNADFYIRFLQSSTIVSSFTARPASSSLIELNFNSTQINTLPIGFYDLKIERSSDSTYQTYSKQILVTSLGDLWSSNSTESSEQKRDGKVDIYDVSRLLSKWGSSQAADLSELDINSGPSSISQGKIDIYDANLMMKNWRP